MIPLPRCQIALGLVVAGLALGACGGDDEPASATSTGGEPTASAPAATAPPPDATQPGTGPVTTPTEPQTAPDGGAGAGGADSGGAAPGEAPDEQEVRVPASFVVVAAGRLEPPQITVPPLLAVEVSIQADDGRAHRLELRTPEPQVLDVAAGRRAAVRIAGLRAGTYPVLLDGVVAGSIVAGGEVGP